MLAPSNLGPYHFLLARAVKSSLNSPSIKLPLFIPKWWTYPQALAWLHVFSVSLLWCRLRVHIKSPGSIFLKEVPKPTPNLENQNHCGAHSPNTYTSRNLPRVSDLCLWFRPQTSWFRSLCSVLRALWKYNLHTVKFTHFKCTIQWFLVNLQSWATLTTIHF